VPALVVYESFWGNTAAIARAVAEGIGDARALTTDEATPELVATADLVVAGAPLLGFQLPTDAMRGTLPTQAGAPSPADVAHPSMRAWLAGLPRAHASCAAFETRISWSPGSSAKSIQKAMEAAGFHPVRPVGKFLVTGRFGPLKDGELERARAWGAEIAAKAALARVPAGA
jgi:hypothetical protein